MNKYKHSIEEQNQKEFLLGRGKYFIRDRDYGTHDSTNTIYYIFDFLKNNNENYSQLDNDLIAILNDEFLSTSDLAQVLNIVWCYLTRRYEKGELGRNWLFSNELKKLITEQISKHREAGTEMSQIDWYLNSFENRFKVSLFS